MVSYNIDDYKLTKGRVNMEDEEKEIVNKNERLCMEEVEDLLQDVTYKALTHEEYRKLNEDIDSIRCLYRKKAITELGKLEPMEL